MNKIIVYHGSSQIVKIPEIRITKYNKDFYFGFYCTIMEKQAKRWVAIFVKKGLAKFKYPTHQISFHTARALTTLKFLEGVMVYGEE